MLERASVLSAGIVLFCVLALSSMRMKSATYDEPIYVTAGYTHLALRDFRVNPQTPPLAKTSSPRQASQANWG